MRATQRYCDEIGVKLLDESVVLCRFKFKRDRFSGHIMILRSFSFEFSTTGEARYLGKVEVMGQRVLSVQLEPHRI